MPLLSAPTLHDSRLWRGLRVGLLGGSFNPPHEGHVHISRIALRKLGLDCIWWLVTPQNPLKSAQDLRPFNERMKLCQALTASHPRIVISDVETRLGTNLSYDTLKILTNRYPETGFVWLTGMDNALQFHKWYRWQDILKLVPTAHIARPPAENIIERCPLRSYSRQNHIILNAPQKPALTPGNTFWILGTKMVSHSSTAIRNELDNKV